MEKIDFIQYFGQNHGHGNNLIIKGGVGKGKTTLLSLIIKLLLDYSNFVIVSNVRLENKIYQKYPLRLFYISGIKQYLDFYTKVPYSQPILLIVDDSQGEDSFTSKGVLSDGGRTLASFMIYIRKLSTSMIYIAHQRYIPASMVDGFEPYYIYKTDKQHFVVSQEFFEKDSDSLKDSDSIICEMPSFEYYDKYYLNILSHAFTSFAFDIDWAELKLRLSQYHVEENLKEEIEKYLSEIEYQNTNEYNEYETLKSIPFTKYYLGLCLKKGFIIPTSAKINEIINPQLTKRAEKEILDNDLLHKI